MTAPDRHVAVVGGGPIGLASAWKLAESGFAVTVIDPRPGSGASFAAAGMLAPVSEAHFGEEELLRLNLYSARIYPAFVAELEKRTGRSVGFRPTGTLTVAYDAGDRESLRQLVDYHHRLGLDARSLTSGDARQLEPAVAPGVAGAVEVPGDHQLDPRLLTAALAAASSSVGVHLVHQRARRIRASDGSVDGVELDDGSLLGCGHVVVAAGSWSPEVIDGLLGPPLPIRPVKGQILTLGPPEGARIPAPLLVRNLRALVEGRYVYLVPRPDGRVVLGATVEERGFDTTVTVEAVSDLLRLGRLVVPAIAEMEVLELVAGLRPGSPDNGPLIGPAGPRGLVVATGHYRNGILLTPVTAETVVSAVETGKVPPVAAPFSPSRFRTGMP